MKLMHTSGIIVCCNNLYAHAVTSVVRLDLLLWLRKKNQMKYTMHVLRNWCQALGM